MTTDRAWGYVVVAGLLEVVWAVGLKYTQGFSRPGPSLLTGAAMVASMWLLAQALRVLPAGTGYAVWTGIGAVGTAVVGMLLLGESRAMGRMICLALIVGGILGLRFLGVKG